MTNKDLESRLQEFAKKNLEKTVYSENSKKYQESQLDIVITEIENISSKHPNFNDIIENITLIPSREEIGGIKIEKIGTSAQNCLTLLYVGNYKNTLGGLFFVVEKYLVTVISQVQESLQTDSPGTAEGAACRLFQEYIDEFKTLTESATAKVDTLDKLARTVESDVERVEATADSIIPNMLSVLGIFVGIIVAVVACYLSELITCNKNELYNHTLPVEFMRYLLMGHIILMVTFILLFLISKLTNRSISTRCSEFEPKETTPSNQKNNIAEKGVSKEVSEKCSKCSSDQCDNCKNRCGPLARFKYLYTYMFAINVILFISYIIVGIWHTINVYYRKYFNQLMADKEWTILLIAGLLTIVFFSVLGMFQDKTIREKKKKERIKNKKKKNQEKEKKKKDKKKEKAENKQRKKQERDNKKTERTERMKRAKQERAERIKMLQKRKVKTDKIGQIAAHSTNGSSDAQQ